MTYHAIIIGGGFFGCCIAIRLAEAGRRVLLVEREQTLLSRASFVNQARLHMGYHYPRSYRTAASSRANLKRFMETFPTCVDKSFTALYALASTGSKVEKRYFEAFCRQLSLPLKAAQGRYSRLFSPRHVQAIYECEEYAFDANSLRQLLSDHLDQSSVDVRTGTTVERVAPTGHGVAVFMDDGQVDTARWVFNATYAHINRLSGLNATSGPAIKHQIAEVCLIEPPPELAAIGVTIMDGPFLSTMPFPARSVHSLTHVRYTPHKTWRDTDSGASPDDVLGKSSRQTRYPWMMRDARRFVPCMVDAKYVESLFDIKSVLLSAEIDDARPMTFHRDAAIPNVISVLGGKLDNVYDVLHYIDQTLDM